MKNNSQLIIFGLIAIQVILNFIIGIFASRLEKEIGIKSNTLIFITILALFSLTFVTFRIWAEEQKNSIAGSFDNPKFNFWGIFKTIAQSVRIEYILMFIPIGMTLGALLALILVPSFPQAIKLPVKFSLGGLSADLVLEFAHWYELIGVVVLMLISLWVSLRFHGIGGLFLLASGIMSFVTVFTVLDPENHFMLSLIGWFIPITILFLTTRGLIALFASGHNKQ